MFLVRTGVFKGQKVNDSLQIQNQMTQYAVLSHQCEKLEFYQPVASIFTTNHVHMPHLALLTTSVHNLLLCICNRAKPIEKEMLKRSVLYSFT